MLIRVVTLFLLPFLVCCNERHNYFRYDYEYNEKTNYWFKINPVPATWHEARKKCNFEGAVLASPLNPDILSILQSAMYNNNFNRTYIGLHSTFTDNANWHSLEGVPIKKMNLDPNIRFSQQSDPHCAVYDTNYIINVNCVERYPFVCYKDATEVPKMTVCGTVDPEYVLDIRTGNCYKFHRKGETWSRGFEICAAEGGYLAIIDNEIEAQVIIDIYEKNPNTTIKSNHPDAAVVGVKDWEGNREWYTIHGEALNTKTYSKWGDGEPNNNGNNEYCGSIFRNGLLNDVPCHIPLAFICEKDRKSLIGDEHL